MGKFWHWNAVSINQDLIAKVFRPTNEMYGLNLLLYLAHDTNKEVRGNDLTGTTHYHVQLWLLDKVCAIKG